MSKLMYSRKLPIIIIPHLKIVSQLSKKLKLNWSIKLSPLINSSFSKHLCINSYSQGLKPFLFSYSNYIQCVICLLHKIQLKNL